jgi:hypothetical protein
MLRRSKPTLPPPRPRLITPDIAARLTEIDNRVEALNLTTVDGSDIETLTYAIHNLIGCIRDLDGS